MAFLTHAMQANQVWTFLGRYTPETLFILAHPPELRSPVLLPAKGLGRMPEHHGKSMQRRLPARNLFRWLAAQPPNHPSGGSGRGTRVALGRTGTATAIPAHRSQSLGWPGRGALAARISWPLVRTSARVSSLAFSQRWVFV